MPPNWARQILGGEITNSESYELFPVDTNDDEIETLYSLIEHIPKAGGLFGVSKKTYELYIFDILDMIEKLEKKGS
ncbi:MAG: hypothetical protein IPJ86_00185 [Bacteroidetes bacterium]|nr:hypothetical protein [Bacteroidota bacterium]